MSTSLDDNDRSIVSGFDTDSFKLALNCLCCFNILRGSGYLFPIGSNLGDLTLVNFWKGFGLLGFLSLWDILACLISFVYFVDVLQNLVEFLGLVVDNSGKELLYQPDLGVAVLLTGLGGEQFFNRGRRFANELTS